MKERQILFNGAMVRAILEGRKTQTRRVIKPQPERVMLDDLFYEYTWKTVKKPKSSVTWSGRLPEIPPRTCALEGMLKASPCQVGDRLWVREAWQKGFRVKPYEYVYKASQETYSDYDADEWPIAWRPSIHMPREASRITLEVTGVRVERVQGITDDDALAEGVTPLPRTCTMYHGVYRNAFAALWDSLHAKRGYGWAANPWVWVVEFRRAEG